jgi:hypothetical protein
MHSPTVCQQLAELPMEFGRFGCAKLAIKYTLTLWSAVIPLFLGTILAAL